MSKVEYMTESETFKMFSVCKKPNANTECIYDYVYRGFDINDCLRSGDNSEKNVIDRLNREFVKITAERPFYLLRGMKNPLLRRLINGKLNDPAFCSTTISKNIAERFVKSEWRDEQCCILHIHFEPGTYDVLPICTMLNNSGHKHEKEVLLPAGTKLEVIENRALLEGIAKTMHYEKMAYPPQEYEGETPSKMPGYPIYVNKDGIFVVIMKLSRNSPRMSRANSMPKSASTNRQVSGPKNSLTSRQKSAQTSRTKSAQASRQKTI